MVKTENTYDFVLDYSITMAWCFEDEISKFSDHVLDQLERSTAIVPTIWPLEVANVLLIAERNKRITPIQSSSFVDALSTLPITIDPSTTTRAMHSIYVLAGKTKLTIYDAAYLELAIREKIPLASNDKDLLRAAKKLKIIIL